MVKNLKILNFLCKILNFKPLKVSDENIGHDAFWKNFERIKATHLAFALSVVRQSLL